MERRKHQRTSISVDLRVETHGKCIPGIAQDISSRGLFLKLPCIELDEHTRDIQLHFGIDTGMQVMSRKINGKIVRKDQAGIAVRFCEYDVLARAVVHELMYYMRLAKQEGVTQEFLCRHQT